MPPMPDLSNSPAAVLNAWTALEVLAPPTFRRPEQLSGGDRRAVARLGFGKLPWIEGEKARPGTRLFYHVVIGSLDFSKSVDRLLSVYADERPERMRSRERAVIASVLIDQAGRPVEQDAAAVSSFAWALRHALSGDLENLGRWVEHERRLTSTLAEHLVRTDKDGERLPLTRELIRSAFSWLIGELGLPADLVEGPEFAIRVYPSLRRAEPPEPLLLNSFYLEDLAAAADLFRQGRAPLALRRYLGTAQRGARENLLADDQILDAAVAPALFPPGRWPAPDRRPLVLLQQAAVNLFSREQSRGEILGINGPPGTGKTTLLRDVVADQVTRRAEKLLLYDDPEVAFTDSGQRLRAGNGWIHLYRLSPELRGHEVLVASSNNHAVENVTAELPAKEAIAEDLELSYFPTLSDALLQRETWGAVAAVLGNAANRSRFRQSFWWDDDAGLRRYLLEATGNPQNIEETDPRTGVTTYRIPRIIEAERPPADHREALTRWRQAKERFADTLAEARAAIDAIDTMRLRSRALPTILSAGLRYKASVEAKPGFWARLFRTRTYRNWREQNLRIRSALDAAFELNAAMPASLLRNLVNATKRGSDPLLTDALSELDALARSVAAEVEATGDRAIGERFLAAPHEARQKTVPWLDQRSHHLRDEVFAAAMDLHKAFIGAAAKPLRHNLGALMSYLGGQAPTGPETAELVPDLWASLFIAVPVVSTTFASGHRMLGSLPPETLGCLIVDEAGQAVPQSAVGALIRCRRALIVGDPIQVPPVVTLPAGLTTTICRRFGVDPMVYNAPEASVQTLADAASAYFTEFETDQGSRTVGAPLLVHRRCAEPMFSIANAVAYSGLMVQAKSPGPSAIKEILGSSGWADVRGSAYDKWCPAEGEYLLEMLRRLAAADVAPDLFVVTPFVAVQDGLRRAVENDEPLAGWLKDPRAWAYDRIGTIHTVQGREAEAVFFVLGAQMDDQLGARVWAGKQPNLLNVAVTRAKEVLYVIGARDAWSDVGFFKTLSSRLPAYELQPASAGSPR